MQFEHEGAGVLLWQRNVDPLFKPETDKRFNQPLRIIKPLTSSMFSLLFAVMTLFIKLVCNTHLLLIAESSVHGIFVAPRTRIPSLSIPTPERRRTFKASSVVQLGISCDLFLLTLHLDEELCLDPARCLALVLAPGATEGVDLIDENDGWLVFAG